jgi:gamma-glutamylcyclotransferase (GGCT)/AIG2-like uncharacterized protein YtfP
VSGDEVAAGDLLVVYGTLLSGLGHQERLGVVRGLELVGPCRVRGALFALGWYPGLVLDGGAPALAAGDGSTAVPEGLVTGELFRVLDPAVVAVLDRFEGFDPASPDTSEYLRVRVRVVEPEVDAWVYAYVGPRHPDDHLTHGDWRRHLGDGGT